MKQLYNFSTNAIKRVKTLSYNLTLLIDSYICIILFAAWTGFGYISYTIFGFMDVADISIEIIESIAFIL